MVWKLHLPLGRAWLNKGIQLEWSVFDHRATYIEDEAKTMNALLIILETPSTRVLMPRESVRI